MPLVPNVSVNDTATLASFTAFGKHTSVSSQNLQLGSSQKCAEELSSKV